MPGAPCNPNIMQSGLKQRPLGMQNAHKFFALSDKPTCQNPERISNFVLNLHFASDSTSCSMLGKYPACDLDLEFNFRNWMTILLVLLSFLSTKKVGLQTKGISPGGKASMRPALSNSSACCSISFWSTTGNGQHF